MYKPLALLAVLLAVATASHFRYGVITYAPTGAPRTLRFQIDQAWRRSAFGITAVGQQFTIGSLFWGDGTWNDIIITTVSSLALNQIE